MIPPTLRQAAREGTHTALMISALGVLAHLSHAPLLFPSLGPTALALAHPPRPTTRAVLGGHLLGIGCGLLALTACGLLHHPNALVEGVSPARVLAVSLSLGGTSALMRATHAVHGPACATTLIISLGLMRTPDQLAAMIVALLLLTLMGRSLNVAGRTTR